LFLIQAPATAHPPTPPCLPAVLRAGATKKEGHDLLSQEKPILLRGEAERDLAIEKARAAAAAAKMK
jgi:hypothetical protein